MSPSPFRPQVLIAEFTGWRTFWLEVLGWGRMFVFRKPAPYGGEPWGFDNGAFTAWTSGKPWDAEAYRRRLDVAHSIGRPILSIVPDVVAGGLASLEFSLEWLDRLPTDWPWYLAVQDGMACSDVEPVLGRFRGIFLGGSDAFKQTAPQWSELAMRTKKQFHYGRAGTPAKLRHARDVWADSLDSSFPLWEDKRFWEFARLWMKGDAQPLLFETHQERGAC